MSLKICVQDDTPSSPVVNEVTMLRRLKKLSQQKDHPGLGFTRLADDIFEVDDLAGGRHYCIASKPQGCSLRKLQETFPDARLPKLLVKSLVHRLWFSINWLHSVCEHVHTGKFLKLCPRYDGCILID